MKKQYKYIINNTCIIHNKKLNKEINKKIIK